MTARVTRCPDGPHYREQWDATPRGHEYAARRTSGEWPGAIDYESAVEQSEGCYRAHTPTAREESEQ